MVQAALFSGRSSYFSLRMTRGLQVRCEGGSSMAFLQATNAPSTKFKSLGGCKHPTRPVPLRRHVAGPHDVLVELVTVCPHAAACALPPAQELPQELTPLLELGTLQPITLVPRLRQLERQLAATGEEELRGIAQQPSFMAFLERSLELVTQRGLGPTAPVLLLSLLSRLRLSGGTDAEAGLLLREAYANFHRHLVNVLQDSIKREAQSFTPQAVLRCYEAWAAMDLPVAPSNSSIVAIKLREHLRSSSLAREECLRLFLALSAIYARSEFRPSNYDVSDLVSGFLLVLEDLRPRELGELADACAAFDWPLYRSPVWALECVAQEVVRRLGTGTLALEEAETLLGRAVEAARRIRPRLGGELEGRVEQWMLAHRAVKTAQGLASWAEAEAAAAALSNVVALTLVQHQQALPSAEAPR